MKKKQKKNNKEKAWKKCLEKKNIEHDFVVMKILENIQTMMA